MKTCLAIILLLPLAVSAPGQAIDLSDSAVEKFMAFPFQYDYTRVTDETSLRELIDRLDDELTLMDVRGRREFFDPDSAWHRRFSRDLEGRYNRLLDDNYLFDLLSRWQKKTTDPVSKAFLDALLEQRRGRLLEPGDLMEMRQLAQRLSERLYNFQFQADGRYFKAVEAARLIESGADPVLARELFRRQNDSAATLAADASRLYFLYNRLGQRFGHPSSFDQNIARLSLRRDEWAAIAQGLADLSAPETTLIPQTLQKGTGRNDLALYEVELILRDSAALPDSLFSAARCDSALGILLTDFGWGDLLQRVRVKTVPGGEYPALAVRLNPPYDNLLIKNDQGGFEYYQRLAAEWGRLVMWAGADTALPVLLRDYPPGTEEALSCMIGDLAQDSAFLAKHFGVAAEDLGRFVRYNRWLRVWQIRLTLLYFFFDYYLSQGSKDDPTALYWSLEASFLGLPDSSYHWIETLLMGSLGRYPTWVAHIFTRLKLEEILYRQFGPTWHRDPVSGSYLVASFCRPGRTQSLEQFLNLQVGRDLSVADFRRQLGLK